MSANPSRAARFRELAASLAPKIDRLRGPRLENTPKRACQGMSARLEAANLERVQIALGVLAAGHEAGTLPPELADISNRSQMELMVSKGTESRSYYHVCESDKYRDDSATARTLRAYVEQHKGGEARQREEAAAKASALADLEREVKFSPIPGFFPTPADVVEQMLAGADLVPGMNALDPSAGKGDILEALNAAGCTTKGIEINHTLAGICAAKKLDCDQADFMECPPFAIYDRVVMNPPFEKGQDAAHVRRAFDWLKPGGRLVALVSKGTAYNSRLQWFRDWLDSVGSVSEDLPDGSFSGADAFRQTGVSIVMLTIDKPGPEFVAPKEVQAPLFAPVVAPTPVVTAEAPKPEPVRVHAVTKGRPPDMPATLSAAAQSILAALAKVGRPANKADLLAAGADRAEWSAGLSECYRARKVKRVPGADVLHSLA